MCLGKSIHYLSIRKILFKYLPLFEFLWVTKLWLTSDLMHDFSRLCRTKEADSLRRKSRSFISLFIRMMKWSRQVKEGGEGAQWRVKALLFLTWEHDVLYEYPKLQEMRSASTRTPLRTDDVKTKGAWLYVRNVHDWQIGWLRNELCNLV